MSLKKHLERCAQRGHLVEILGTGTVVVPSVAKTPQSTVTAWIQYLALGPEATVMVLSGEPGRCWIRHPHKKCVIAYG